MSIETIENAISQSLEREFKTSQQSSVGGGSINQAKRLEGLLDGTEAARFFLKVNSKNLLWMFEAESDGLLEMESANAIKVPHAVCTGVVGSQSFIVLENLEMGSGAADSAAKLGTQLANLHRKTAKDFGWSRDNTIGSTEQVNDPCADWIAFYREQRLGFQLDLAKRNGGSRRMDAKGHELMAQLDRFFESYQPVPSLLHGDLWSGNYGYLVSGEPVIFDPAVYYGDREADIAMTELFGGFPGDFYLAYNQAWPLDEGYQQRKTLYNLYHILNHFNLFGGGYGMQAEGMIDRLIR